ncbi:TolC family protein [Adhaeretor mobilis]|nr:TolC family protein [Adhaeretor mobilis]
MLVLFVGLSYLGAVVGCRQTPKNYATVTGTVVQPLAEESTSLVVRSGSADKSGDSVLQVNYQEQNEDQQIPLRLPETLAAPKTSKPEAVPAEKNDASAENPIESVTSVGQSVGYFLGIATASHPRVRAARARVAAASQRAPQAQALDDPTLTNSFYPISDQALQTAAGRAGNTMSIAQKYPWPEKRWTKAAIADRETQIAAAKLAQVELEVEETVRLAYYELWFADRAITITDENRQIAAELVKLAEARYGAGGRQQDVLRAQLQLDTLEERLIGLRRQKSLAQADLAALVQQPAMTGIEPTGELPIAQVPQQLDALFAAAGECSPRLRERQWAVSRDRQKQQLACLSKYPDFTLGAGWQTITESDAVSPVANGHDNVNFVVVVTLPIWRDKINASIREASAEVAASSREFNDARDDTFRQIRRLSEQAYAADEQLRLYNERILPRAKRTLQLASADYRGKLVDFGEVTDGFTEVLMFELQVARTKATIAGAIAQLHRAVGCEVAVDAE